MDWFYNKEISLLTETGGSMSHGSWVNGIYCLSKTIACDVQPASREQIYKEYGYYIECSQRVFCDKDTDLEAGAIVEYDGDQYKIVKIVKWDNYMDIFIQNVDVSGNE